jgi:hypothetical protein
MLSTFRFMYPRTMQVGPFSRKQLGYIVAAGGALIVLVCLLAEPLGVGSGGGIHVRQIIGAVVGGVILLIGLGLAFGPEGAPRAADDTAAADAEPAQGADQPGDAGQQTVASPSPTEPPPADKP